jgi:hypothetical protein
MFPRKKLEANLTSFTVIEINPNDGCCLQNDVHCLLNDEQENRPSTPAG